VGIAVAQEIATWQIEQVEVLTVTGLTFDLAEQLSRFERAIFVDACPSLSIGASIELLHGSDYMETFTHHCNINSLISLTQWLYGRSPQVWLLGIAALDFSLGDCLSPIARIGKTEAITIVKYFFEF